MLPELGLERASAGRAGEGRSGSGGANVPPVATVSRLAKKLRLARGQRAAIPNPPAGYLRMLTPLPEGIRVLTRLAPGLDFAQVFVRDTAELPRRGPAAIRAVKPNGLLWIAYPKGGRTTGLTDLPATPWWMKRDVLGEITGEKGYVPIAFVRIDQTWTALRFKRARSR